MTGEHVVDSDNPADGTLASSSTMYIPFEADP